MEKRVIEISESNYTYLFLNNLVVNKDGTKITIPTSQIDTVLFENDKLTITLPLINDLVDHGINIIVCGRNHMPKAQIIPFQGYYNAKILQKQIKWDNDFKERVWRRIIKLKIRQTMVMLEHLAILRDDDKVKLEDYANSVKAFDITNCEGHCAKLNFKILFGEKFVRKTNTMEDTYNAYLNYGYSVLLSYVARAICSKGYDNRLGIFHRSYSNFYPLACDLMEPFRCIVESLVYKHVRISRGEPNFQEFKEELFTIFYKHFNCQGENLMLIDCIDKLVVLVLSDHDIKGPYFNWSAE
ncbi:CRISPR-associated endonuclease Cas1, subtype II/NMENI [Metamycoplasma arthritidis]|uniref:CRISPR-associated endonuclease Cas1 n=1 Tax=Metamycoplasma arthritidis (strain 158L3-1) TaxID=243272 RepID=B3PMY9_META1|nr:type II CRISPR-associated endonuclease Cas1 [Metamycoplasma arthritidis]ACF07391.1 conserved hypothetical protein [Metamycoplasma arthritidis 158L3-1]VEU78912.1 CRISPR-associated endonuclease Cas1, subtype II/NMENI [Metamycoplasma arthritidis]